jgi:catechol 2,3-dioxygenase-like lactoylglutathione lyase family enzyme
MHVGLHSARLHSRVDLDSAMLALADVAVVVSNAKATAEWWEKNLGFVTHTVGGTGHAILVAPPGDRFVLHLCEGFAPLEPGDTGIAFVTDEIENLVAGMMAGSVRFPEPLRKEEWGKMAKFSDPDGNVFWLMEAPTAMVRQTLQSRAPGDGPRRRSKSALPGTSSVEVSP